MVRLSDSRQRGQREGKRRHERFSGLGGYVSTVKAPNCFPFTILHFIYFFLAVIVIVVVVIISFFFLSYFIIFFRFFFYLSLSLFFRKEYLISRC